MKLKIATLLLFLSVFSSAQTPCISGFAGVYPCNNIDLLSHLSITQLGGGAGNDYGVGQIL